MAEITRTGYKLKTQNEWFNDERAMYLDIDPLWNLDPSTPDGLKLAHDAEVFGALDETMQQAYNSKDPNKATGYELDVICALTGTKRSEGSASTATVTLTGVAGYPVAAGFRIRSRTTGTLWRLDSTHTIGAGGTVDAGFTCTSIGAVEADAGTLTEIVDTITGLLNVTNAEPSTLGTSVETDSSLRTKRATAVGRPGNNQVDSMYGELYAVTGVRRVRVYENDTDTVDSNGLPAHSTASIVDGGTDDDVAQALYIKKCPGTTMYQVGTPVTVDVRSTLYPSNVKTIKFSRPDYVDILVVVNVAASDLLPSQEVLQSEIQEAIMEYAAGDLIPTEYGFKPDGFDIGENVPFGTLYTPVNKVLGLYGNAYVETMTINGGTDNIAISFNQLSRWTTSNIMVNIV